MGCNCGGGKLKSKPTDPAEKKRILQKRRAILLKQQQKTRSTNTATKLKKLPTTKTKVI